MKTNHKKKKCHPKEKELIPSIARDETGEFPTQGVGYTPRRAAPHMNLYELATHEHNRRVHQRRIEEPAAAQLSFEMQEAVWSVKPTAEKRAGSSKRLGSWRQRRGNPKTSQEIPRFPRNLSKSS